MLKISPSNCSKQEVKRGLMLECLLSIHKVLGSITTETELNYFTAVCVENAALGPRGRCSVLIHFWNISVLITAAMAPADSAGV